MGEGAIPALVSVPDKPVKVMCCTPDPEVMTGKDKAST